MCIDVLVIIVTDVQSRRKRGFSYSDNATVNDESDFAYTVTMATEPKHRDVNVGNYDFRS